MQDQLSFAPVSGAHSIESCLVAVRLAQAVDPNLFTAIQAFAQKIAQENDLPGHQSMALPPFVAAMVPQPFVQGNAHVYQRFAPNGTIEAELRCEPQGIIFIVRKYDRWAQLRSVLDRTVLALLPMYLGALPAIQAVQLQYEDAFVSQGDDLVAGRLFRPESRWINLYDRDTNQQWHSHFGIFLQESEEKRQLVNVNVNVNDNISPDRSLLQRKVSVMTLIGDMFDIPGQQPLILDPADAGAAVGAMLDQLHDQHKIILQETLTDEYLDAVGFEK